MTISLKKRMTSNQFRSIQIIRKDNIQLELHMSTFLCMVCVAWNGQTSSSRFVAHEESDEELPSRYGRKSSILRFCHAEVKDIVEYLIMQITEQSLLQGWVTVDCLATSHSRMVGHAWIFCQRKKTTVPLSSFLLTSWKRELHYLSMIFNPLIINLQSSSHRISVDLTTQ